MRDVGEGTSVHETRRAVNRLDKIRLKRIAQQCRHRACRVEVARRDGRACIRACHLQPGKACLQILQILREAENSHDLARRGDVKAVLARRPVRLSAQSADDAAQLAVVHVEAAPPCHLTRVNAELIALLNMVIDHRCKQVVRRSDGMQVAREMQVNLLHGQHLRVAAASRTALHAENGSKRRFTKRKHCLPADFRHAVCKPDRNGRFALAGRGRIDGGDKNQFRVMIRFIELLRIDLRDIGAVGAERAFGNARFICDIPDFFRRRRLRDFKIRWHRILSFR